MWFVGHGFSLFRTDWDDFFRGSGGLDSLFLLLEKRKERNKPAKNNSISVAYLGLPQTSKIENFGYASESIKVTLNP